jgi:hypothetical protein
LTAISTANLKWYLSGTATSAAPTTSLGGSINTATGAWTAATALDDLFADVTGTQAAAGVTQYLCLYFRNEDTNANGLLSGAIYVGGYNVMPADANDKIALAIGSSAKNGTEQTVVNITTAPTGGVSFTDGSSCTTYATGLALPTPMTHNDWQAIWLRRTIGAGATASGAVYTITGYSGDGTTGTVTCGASIPTGSVVTIAGTSATTIDGTYQATNKNSTQFYITTAVTSCTYTSATTTVPSGFYLAVGGDSTA